MDRNITIEEYLTRLMDAPELLEYVQQHPDATPEEVLAHFGVPFHAGIFNSVIDELPATVDNLRSSPNPNDRAWTTKRS